MPVPIHIIEDDIAVSDSVKELVAGERHEVFANQDPDDFFASRSPKPRDIIVPDVHFPLGSGIDVAERLRRDLPELRIVVISGTRLGTYAKAATAIAPAASFRKALNAAAFITVLTHSPIRLS